MVWMIVTIMIEENNGKEGFHHGSPRSLTWVMQEQAATATPRDQMMPVCVRDAAALHYSGFMRE
jgi:hypothetical protein